MNDRQLLCEFAATRSETAFRDLTDRHLNLVYSTALRRVGGDAQMAQDVSQAVFILLARKAGELSSDTVLAGWLYRTTQFVAGRALRSKLRRTRREQEALQMQEHASADSNWEQLAPLLDEALGKLKDDDRNAILLRYFEENSLLKVGLALGVSEAAAGKRIARALESLRGFFGKRGFTLTAAALAAALGHGSAKAAPAGLGSAVVNSVFAHTPAASATCSLLVQETLKAWQWVRFRWVLGVGAALVATTLFVLSPVHQKAVPAAMPASQPALRAAAPINDAPSAAPVAATTVERTNVLKFQAVDAVTGKGVPGARVLAVIAEDPEHIQHFTNLVTDDSGFCAVPRSANNQGMLAVGVLANGYEERCVVGGGPYPLPEAYVLKLPRGANIGGIIQDESGQPISGAAIQISFYGTGDSSDREFQRERPGFPDDMTVATTDVSGRWNFGSAAATTGSFYLEVRHPAFSAQSFHDEEDARNYAGKVGRFKSAELLAGTAVFVLSRGLSLQGIVTDDQNHPIADATVRFGPFDVPENPATRTAPDGSFTISPVNEGSGVVTVMAKGWSPERQTVEISEKSPTLAIQLKPAAHLRLRVEDEAGSAMGHVDVRLQAWRGYNTLDWGGFTDANGRIEWDSAPHDQLNIYAGKEGYFNSRDNYVTADGEEHTIVMHPQATVTGSVTDAATGKPIARFKVVPGEDRSMLANGTNGAYSLTISEYRRPLEIHFEADGYEIASAELSPKTNQQVCNLSLQPATPAETVQGVILLPDGTPAADARVELCTAQRGAQVGEGKFIDPQSSTITNTDASGHFAFPTVQAPRALVAMNGQGFAQFKLNSDNRNVTLQLQPWGRLEGVLKLRSQQNANRSIQLMTPMTLASHDSFRVDRSTQTDAQGNFVFEKLPPGDFSAYLNPGMYQSMSHQTPVQITPGQTAQVQIGGTGITVTGQFIQSVMNHPIDWTKQTWNCNLGTKYQAPPVPPELKGPDRRKWTEDYWNSDEGIAAARGSRVYPLNLEADGKFSVEDVPPGNYELRATLLSQPVESRDVQVGMHMPFAGRVNLDVVVPELLDGSPTGALDLGTVTVQTQISNGR